MTKLMTYEDRIKKRGVGKQVDSERQKGKRMRGNKRIGEGSKG
jgi:hypothetical protein